jgi:hypothetical protein
MFPPDPVLLLPSLRAVCATRLRCGCRGGSCCGAAVEKPCKIKTNAVLRFHGEAMKRNRVRSEPRCGPLFDTVKTERDRVRTWGQRIMEEKVNSTILLEHS